MMQGGEGRKKGRNWNVNSKVEKGKVVTLQKKGHRKGMFTGKGGATGGKKKARGSHWEKRMGDPFRAKGKKCLLLGGKTSLVEKEVQEKFSHEGRILRQFSSSFKGKFYRISCVLFELLLDGEF